MTCWTIEDIFGVQAVALIRSTQIWRLCTSALLVSIKSHHRQGRNYTLSLRARKVSYSLTILGQIEFLFRVHCRRHALSSLSKREEPLRLLWDIIIVMNTENRSSEVVFIELHTGKM